MRWHSPPDTEFEIRVLAVWCRARYLSVTEAPHTIESLRVRGGGEVTVCFFETWRPERGLNPLSTTFQADGLNHCTRGPTHEGLKHTIVPTYYPENKVDPMLVQCWTRCVDGGPTLNQHRVLCICITFVKYWTNVEAVKPTLYKCYTSVLCLLGTGKKQHNTVGRPASMRHW